MPVKRWMASLVRGVRGRRDCSISLRRIVEIPICFAKSAWVRPVICLA